MSDLTEFDDYLGRYQIRNMQDLIQATRKFNYVVLPFEPSVADIGAISRALPKSGSSEKHAKDAYKAMIDRRIALLEFVESKDTPTKAPKVRQD